MRDGRPQVHAILYTATCGEILEPVLLALAKEGRVRLSATTMLPVAAHSHDHLEKRKGIEVHTDLRALVEFVSTPGRKLLLLVADFTHPAHSLGADAVRSARRVGIPSLSFQHGACMVDAKTGAAWGWDFTADRVCVWGDWYRDRLMETGKTKERFLVTGNPRLSERGARARLSSQPSTAPRTALVALATHAHLEDPEMADRWDDDRVVDMVSGVLTGLRQSGYERVLVRPHPAEYFWKRTWVYDAASKRSNTSIEYSDYFNDAQPSLFDVLRNSDIVVTQGSTVGLYAVHRGAPVISMELDEAGLLEWRNPYPDGVLYQSTDPYPDGLPGRIEACASAAPDRGEVVRLREQFLKPFLQDTDAVREICSVVYDSTRRT